MSQNAYENPVNLRLITLHHRKYALSSTGLTHEVGSFRSTTAFTLKLLTSSLDLSTQSWLCPSKSDQSSS